MTRAERQVVLLKVAGVLGYLGKRFLIGKPVEGSFARAFVEAPFRKTLRIGAIGAGGYGLYKHYTSPTRAYQKQLEKAFKRQLKLYDQYLRMQRTRAFF